jgi:hypothetical protein
LTEHPDKRHKKNMAPSKIGKREPRKNCGFYGRVKMIIRGIEFQRCTKYFTPEIINIKI